MSSKDSSERINIKHEELQGLSAKLLEAVGVSKEDADIVSALLVDADLKGIESHGVRWLDFYIKRIDAGLMETITKIETVFEKASLLHLDANNGLGQVAAVEAVNRGIEKARENGVCVVGLRNTNHFGAAGYYAELAAKENMIATVMTNGTPLMPPWGGVDLCLGTNPVAYGFPNGEVPIIFDMATSAVARGKVFVAAYKGTQLPDGVALTKDGVPTNDPREALEGALLPVGGPKGYGLALAIDIISGVLTGSKFGKNIPVLLDDLKRPQHVGSFFTIINIEDFLSLGEYGSKMRELSSDLLNSRLAMGFDRVYLPGGIEANNYDDRVENGIPLATSTWQTLQRWAENLDVK